MRLQAMQDIYKRIYSLPISTQTIYIGLVFLPWNLKIIWGTIVDLDLV
jgi:hypothetical protein